MFYCRLSHRLPAVGRVFYPRAGFGRAENSAPHTPIIKSRARSAVWAETARRRKTLLQFMPDQQWHPKANPWLIALAVIVPTFMEVLDTSIAAVALPNIAGNLSATH